MKWKEKANKEIDTVTMEVVDHMEIEISEMEEKTSVEEDVGDKVEEKMELIEIVHSSFVLVVLVK